MSIKYPSNVYNMSIKCPRNIYKMSIKYPSKVFKCKKNARVSFMTSIKCPS